MKTTIFSKKNKYIDFVLSILFSCPVIYYSIMFFGTALSGEMPSDGYVYWLILVTVICAFLYALLGLYSCIICVIYDWTTSITIDKRMRDVVYYNRYTGTIKFNADDIIEITELSKDHPRLMISYTRIVLKNGVKILLGQFVDAECISDLSPVDCKRDHKESIVYEELLISMIRRKHS